MCECRERINEKLAERNAKISVGFCFDNQDGPSRKMILAPPSIELEKVDKKKRGALPILSASFCPFCGQPYA